MKFCRFCGKQLGDDEVCNCEGALKEAANAAENAAETVAEAAENAAETTAEAATNAAENAEKQAEDGAAAAVRKVKDSINKIDLKGIGEKAKENKSLLVKIGAGIVGILLIILIANLFSAGYKKPIKNIVAAINKGAKADYLTLYNAGLPKDLANLNKEFYTKLYADNLEDKNDELKDNWEDLKDKYPKFKISFKYDSKDKLSKTDLKEIKEELEDGDLDDLTDTIDEIEEELDDNIEDLADALDVDEKDISKFFKSFIKYLKSFNKIKVTSGYKVRGQYIVKNGGDEINKTDKVTMYILKINGEWVIFTTKDGNRFSFDSEKKSYDKINFLRQYLNIFYENAFIPNFF